MGLINNGLIQNPLFIRPNIEPSWFSFRGLYWAHVLSLGHMIVGFKLCWGLISLCFVQSAGVPPGHPAHGLEFHFGG